MPKSYCVYIMTNDRRTVLYKGVSSDLPGRVHRHKARTAPGFTKRYNVDQLVYYEVFEDVHAAIAREKQIKAGSRIKKVDLIQKTNPLWYDLSGDL
jgi:putative endonuclease